MVFNDRGIGGNCNTIKDVIIPAFVKTFQSTSIVM